MKTEEKGKKNNSLFFRLLPFSSLFFLYVLSSCATLSSKLAAPPEFNQKVLLEVGEDYELHQAPRSGYDAGDLQSFHTQHTLPIVVEDTFNSIVN